MLPALILFCILVTVFLPQFTSVVEARTWLGHLISENPGLGFHALMRLLVLTGCSRTGRSLLLYGQIFCCVVFALLPSLMLLVSHGPGYCQTLCTWCTISLLLSGDRSCVCVFPRMLDLYSYSCRRLSLT